MRIHKLIFTYIFLISEMIVYSQSLVEYEIFNYKINGNVKSVIEINSTADNQKDTNDCPTKLVYGKRNRLLKSSYCSGVLFLDYTYVYDEKGNVIYENTPYDRNENTFDENGNLIEHKSNVTDKEYFGKWIYKYDGYNNQIERIGYISDDFIERWIHKYDKDNRRIEEIMVYENSDSIADIKRVFEYDNKDNIIRQLYISYSTDKEERWEDRFKYDIFNNVVEHIKINKNENIKKTTYQYKYDNVDNWIEKICIENGVTKSIYERKIEYK